MARIPSKSEILDWINENPAKSGKRDIARAFGIKGADRIDLKAALRALEDEGHLEKRRKSYREPGSLPPVAVLRVIGPDSDGDLIAEPQDWQGEGDAPRALVLAAKGGPALGPGDRVLARLTRVAGQQHAYEARPIRRIGHAPASLLGVFRTTAEGGRIVPVEKRSRDEWRVRPGATAGARDGELVEAEQAGPEGRIGLRQARVVTRLGDPGAPKAVSLIAIHAHGIPDQFPGDVLTEADAAKPPRPEAREDLRHIPFVTIDPADARDRDDAVWAEPDPDPANKRGHVVWVAIADVAHFVPTGSALDAEARLRGNSTYFPDRVVPMLPDRLSGDLCSLHDGIDRAVIAVRMVLNAEGRRIDHVFHRGRITSRASLTYTAAQAVEDGDDNAVADNGVRASIHALFAAYRAAALARDARQPLELELPERRIILSDDGKVTSVALKDRLEAHRLIEEFMVAANVAATETLTGRRQPLIFRVHEEPAPDRMEGLRETLKATGLKLDKGQAVTPAHLNRLLAQAREGDTADLVSMATLRAMQQAYYHPENLGHFGLALAAYAHFTSPIRRYADLIVHRALIAAHGWGGDGVGEIGELAEIAVQISATERRSMMAERDTTDRYLAAFMAERVGSELTGRIAGMGRAGLFVRLDETGADGLVPMRSVGDEYFRFDRDAMTLKGETSGAVLSMGQRVLVRLSEAAPVTGGLILELIEVDGRALPQGRSSGRRKPGGRKPAKGGKPRRSVTRRRK